MNNRFYPKFIPPFDNEPIKTSFALKDGELGRHVVSLKSFGKGEVIFRFSGLISSKITQHSLQVLNNLHVHDEWFMGFVAHACEPNCYVDISSLSFIAIKNIKIGDFITMDYFQTETKLFKKFKCVCLNGKCSKKQIFA